MFHLTVFASSKAVTAGSCWHWLIRKSQGVLLLGLVPVVCSACTQNHLHMVVPLTSIVKQENVSQAFPHTAQSGGGIFSIEVSSTIMSLTCKVDIKTSQCNWSLLTGRNPVPWRGRDLVVSSDSWFSKGSPNCQDNLAFYVPVGRYCTAG